MYRNWIKKSDRLYFMTNTVSRWKNIFVYSKAIELVLNSFSFYQKINYIHLNPFKKNLVKEIVDFPFSSASEKGRKMIHLNKIKF